MAAKKTTAKQATLKQATAKKTTAKQATLKQATAKKTTAKKTTVKQASAKQPTEGSLASPGVGESAPAFTLLDQAGRTVTSAELIGRAYVIYFYPRDNTPGCTREAQGFRDASGELTAAGVRVFGVSPDSTVSHARFGDQHGLDFALLSDPDRAVARAYGAYGAKRAMGRETEGVIRSTFLVDARGILRRCWRGVRVEGHVAEVLAAARELS